MSLIIRNNEAWIVRIKDSSHFTIYNKLENVAEAIFNLRAEIKTKNIELIRFSVRHGEWKLEQKDEFWGRIFFIHAKRRKG